MFADRAKEDRGLAGAKPGFLDEFLLRFRERRVLKAMAEAAARLFTPGRVLSFRLSQGKHLSLSGARYCRVDCTSGLAWVTVEGHDRDYLVRPGQNVTLAGRGKVVVTGRVENTEVRMRWD